MTKKNSNYKVKLPTQYRTKKSKKKVLKKEGDKLNLSIKKCIICNKKKMERYDLKDPNGAIVTINHCKNCKFFNASHIVAYRNTPQQYPYTITYFNPKPLEDKQ